jgi:tripartite-type tricarboxylate transporter receptor subunit TctC
LIDRIALTATALLCLMSSGLALSADTLPAKGIRLIVGYPPGGSTDIAARLVAQRLQASTGSPVVVENRAGASGTIGAALVAKAEADASVLLFAASPELTTVRATIRNLPYDPARDFAPITLVGRVPFMLVVHPSVPARSLKELLALAKAKPGALNFASFGTGTSNHLAGELLKMAGGVSLTHVPYKGSAPAMTDLLGGHVELAFDTIPVTLPQVKAGKLRALAVTMPRRSPLVPDVPTMEEAGLKGFLAGTWFGLLAPVKTPAALIERLHREVTKILRAPEVEATFAERGIEPVGNTPEEFRTFIDAQAKTMLRVAEQAGLKPE